jgi:radical SAM superfamily enzyme YgiQ (UPF0313 family)
MKNILLVNPWIHDFAAYDFWAKPAGLLLLASILRQHGFSVHYIDCLDRFHPNALKSDPCLRYGRGPYLKTRMAKPEGLKDIPRNYCRYGIREAWFRADLLSIPKPDLVLVTSFMTYWYPGVQATIRVIKEIFPNTPLVLGGIYAALCYDHALKYSGADKVITGGGEKYLIEMMRDDCSIRPEFDPHDLNTYPYPAYHLQRVISYIPIMTSIGCPFSCAYCASHFLNPKLMRRHPDAVADEIFYWHKIFGVRDFVFYDDALLADAEHHALPLLEKIISFNADLRFHTPNAIHIRNISEKLARLMMKANFRTLRLGLETTAFENRSELDRKVTEAEFKQGVAYLKAAGFTKDQVGAYLLAGLPGQTVNAVEDSIRVVRDSGITPVPAYYTPIPHTKMWSQAVACSRYDLEVDPVFTNNALLPCMPNFSWEVISRLKN